mmetsp:Transcript_29105/g.49339  ORF Transcript_29105/g.49339 Transcript_29105/m.49339 type:complete len:810 (+) Transcript_29105:123-2552(+)
MPKSNYTAPIPFIQLDKQEKFRVHEEAVKVFSRIKGKLCIIAVCGPYRTGKSFLLNQFIGKKGFKVGSSINACTKGLWLWGSPVKRGDVTYVFMDSEGLGSMEKSQDHDVSVLSLATLLSSLFVLNTQGNITESSLELLELVAHCSERIRVSDGDMNRVTESESKRMGSNLGNYFPQFIWVLRDFMLELADVDGNAITAKEYLEKSLRPQKGRGKRIQEKNETRRLLTELFPSRDCVTMVRPVYDERQLRNLNSVSSDKLRVEFKQSLATLKSKIWNSGVKMIDGNPVNGPAFIHLARSYTKAINSGSAPTIKTAWQSVVEIQTHEAKGHVLQMYRNQFSLSMNATDEVELIRKHRDLVHKARQYILSTVPGDEKNKQFVINSLRRDMDGLFTERMESNKMKSQLLASKNVDSIWKRLKLDDEKVPVDADRWARSRTQFITEYVKATRGPSKWTVLLKFLEEKTRKTVSYCLNEIKIAVAKESSSKKKCEEISLALRQSEKRIDELSTQKKSLSTISQAQQEKIQQLNSSLQNTEIKYRQERDARGREISKLKKQLSEARQAVEKKEYMLTATSKKISSLNSKVMEASKMVEKRDRQLSILQHAKLSISEALKKESNKVEKQQEQIHTLEKRTRKLQSELSNGISAAEHKEGVKRREFESLRRDLQEKENACRNLSRKLEESQKQNQMLMKKRNSLENDLDRMRSSINVENETRSTIEQEVSIFEQEDSKSEEENIIAQPNVPRLLQPPEKLTVQKLMSRLTKLDVELPPHKMKKKFYVDLLRKHDPTLRGAAAPKMAAPKRKRRRTKN